jgi:type I restriction enzyme S subunit
MPMAAEMHSTFWSYVHAALYAGRLNYPSIKQTTGIQNLDATAYLNEKVSFPPIQEQEAIASSLDRETAKIDTFVTKVLQSIEKLREYRQSLISAAVTGKIDVRSLAGHPASPEESLHAS